MNANTRLRLWKEARALLPFVAATIGLMLLPNLFQATEPLKYATPAYWFGCVVLGAASFGFEFQHRSMGLLLTQPVSRRRLWWEKMAVLAAALLVLMSLHVWLWCQEDWVRSQLELSHWTWTLRRIAVWCYAPIVAFATGPTLTLLTRSLVGGAVLTFFCPFVLSMLGLLLWPLANRSSSYAHSIASFYGVTLCGGIYCGAVLLFGCQRLHRWEDSHGHRQELALPGPLLKLFERLTRLFTPRPGGVLAHLVRKEVRLHLPSFAVAAGLVVMWLALQAAMFISPTLNKGFLLLPVVLLGLGIPVIAGIVSTAEERSLGLLDWHLTLPVSARRQWFIKVLVALGVNVGLGILLPGVLAQAAGSLLEGKPLELGVHNGEQHFLIANAVIFCAALYASTVSANSMRALVGAIVLFVAGAGVLNFADFVAAFHPQQAYAATAVRDYLAEGDILGWLHSHRWPLGWCYFSVWLYFLGLASYQRSLESRWLPVRRMALFFAALCLFIFEAIVW